MVKDSSASTSKRRSKAAAAESEPDGDVYKKVVEFEEKEASIRDPAKDTEMYLQTCGAIKQILTEIYQMKTAPTEDKTAISEKRVEACLLTSILKKFNRLEKVRMLTTREALNVEKQKLESINLQYQNLLYEADHLMNEFRKCKQYKSKDEDIELVTMDEFCKNGPEKIVSKFASKTELDQNENHELHLAMLEHELCQRIKLAKFLEQLELKKKALEKDIINRKAKLDGMEPKLAAVIAATKPLQDHLGLSIEETRIEHKLACHLPDQLYLMYCNTDAYRQFIHRGMTIDIIGDLEELLQFNETHRSINEESDQEPDKESQEEPVEVKKHRHRKGAMVDRNEEKKKKLIHSHPLSVVITISVNNSSANLKMKFCYLPALRIITVSSSFEGQIDNLQNSHCARDVLTGESILNELYDGDYGTESPNPTNFFELKRLGIGNFESLVPELGYAYAWAQKICGLDFLNTQNYKERLNKLRVLTAEETFKKIEQRLIARLHLATQLNQLESNVIPIIPAFVDHPKSASATLSKFSSITYQRFCNDVAQARVLIDNDLVTSGDLFYMATISRPKASLQAAIVIKNNYPTAIPLFFINVKYQGEHNAENSDEIRDMERAVNSDWDEVANGNDKSSWILSAQLRYLCAYLDVYLETNESSSFQRSTVFFHNVCGRNRRRPFKYRKIGNGIFIQY